MDQVIRLVAISKEITEGPESNGKFGARVKWKFWFSGMAKGKLRKEASGFFTIFYSTEEHKDCILLLKGLEKCMAHHYHNKETICLM